MTDSTCRARTCFSRVAIDAGREQARPLPSGYSQSLTLDQHSDARLAFIQKPFTARELLTSLRRLLD